MIQGLRLNSGGTVVETVDGIPSAVSAAVYRGAEMVHQEAELADPWTSVAAYSETVRRGTYRVTVETAPDTSLLGQNLCGTAQGYGPCYPFCVSVDPENKTVDVQGISEGQAKALSELGSRRLEIAVPGSVTTELGEHYRVEWSYTAWSLSRSKTTNFDVVLHPVSLALSLGDFLAANPAYRTWNEELQSAGLWQGLAATAADLVDAELHAKGQRAQLVVSQSRLTPLLHQAARVVLADQGYIPPAYQAAAINYRDGLRSEFERMVESCLASVLVSNDSGTVERLPYRSIRGVR